MRLISPSKKQRVKALIAKDWNFSWGNLRIPNPPPRNSRPYQGRMNHHDPFINPLPRPAISWGICGIGGGGPLRFPKPNFSRRHRHILDVAAAEVLVGKKSEAKFT